MNDKLNNLIDFAKRTVGEIYKEHAKDSSFVLSRVIIGTTKDGEPFMGPCDWSNSEERSRALMNMRINLAIQEVTDYVIVSECWVATMLPGETLATHIQPRDQQDRKEIVNISACSRDGTKVMFVADILRNNSGVPSIGDFKMCDGGLDGDLFNLFETMPELSQEAIDSFKEFKRNLEDVTTQSENEAFIVAPSGSIVVPNTSRYVN